ncbi:C-type mannose receptor 2-like isoform X1 [Alosa alosa]|uniref:C-type mannose receptor 2-like isoform X1 n=2 Tax=Alosa alosa TaxID=278164 RepID=UPI0020151E65|nr:C-type mannose receptor 2-like isoform X1 [Alosa alosa]XP_048089839.1 C-type mannose receptor 2-like isoform X1 [Alosa alosa]
MFSSMISRGSFLLSALLLCCGGEAQECICPEGWSKYESHCFNVVQDEKPWAEAESNCVRMGGHLASVHSKHESSIIEDLINKHIRNARDTWIGGTDVAKEGVWVWSDGSRFDYTHWYAGEPNNYGVGQHCLHMHKGKWDDYGCEYGHPSVCSSACSMKVSFPQCLRTCPGGWSEFGSRCFQFVHTVTTWAEAERNCVRMGGHLASVHSKDEFLFIQDLIHRLTAPSDAPYTWIGGTDAAQEDVWVWSDGSRFDYTHWHSAQPDNYYGGENCAHITGDSWNDISCESGYPSVCSMG